ncbi:lymphocyte cytosolic protein 2-like isoform X2 [Sinocyclocheilus rhinocerous]|uniref:lymphocyte cytosolic protein 2-like isoform X2 n=1 Tax=Sinocyclocheilus rhinocerous TaxID=307959 RepID=UPI0007B98BE2|nr:PREDICTED: lymphocyte cytosolic protein 2-like isoform X2 [Sinocyclocheilus rhinocerous]
MLDGIWDLIFISKCSAFGIMSSDSIPSKSEVLSWDSQRLADFLKKRNLTGCDKVVTRCNINGQRFLSMSDNDLQKFPKLHAPLISKICQEINKEKNWRFFPPIPTIRPSPVPSYPQPPVEQHEDQAWDSEEFSDDDYENPDSNDEGEASGGDYESPEEGSDSDNSYEPPPTEPNEDTAQICPAKPMENSDYIDNNRTRGVGRSQPPVPPERPGPGPALPPVERPSVSPSYFQTVGLPMREERPLKRSPAPAVDRSTKPGALDRSHPAAVAGGRGTCSLDRAGQPPRRLPAVEPPEDPIRIPKPSLPPSGVRRSASSVTPGYSQNRQPDYRTEFHDDTARHNSNTFPLHTRNPSPRPPGTHGQSYQTDNVHPSRSLPAKLQETMNDHQRSARAPPLQADMGSKQDMDPAWYVGQFSRSEAEICLKRVNRDGTFLVRDSSNRSSNQPYTLVVLYQDKVYNIQIRRNQDGFMLGTGLKSYETFERVSDIISQHKHKPLLLIDAKNRESSQQNQCTLIYPARY